MSQGLTILDSVRGNLSGADPDGRRPGDEVKNLLQLQAKKDEKKNDGPVDLD